LVSSIDINGSTHTSLGRKQLVIEARDWDRMQNAITRVMKLA